MIVLTIPAPCEWITANQRLHWAVKSRRVKEWRAATAWRAARAVSAIDGPVHITATIHRDHNRGRFDPNNWADTAKACVDGLVDAGVLRDDSSKYVTGPDMRAGDPWADAALVLTITQQGENA